MWHAAKEAEDEEDEKEAKEEVAAVVAAGKSYAESKCICNGLTQKIKADGKKTESVLIYVNDLFFGFKLLTLAKSFWLRFAVKQKSFKPAAWINC